MTVVLAVLRCAVPSLYAVTVVLYGLLFFGRLERLHRWARPFFWGTFTVHALFLALFIAVNHRIPLAAPAEILTVVAFSTALAYGYVEVRTGSLATGFFALGFSMLFQFAASGRIALEQEVSPLLRLPAFGIHTGAAILGYSAFAVSAVYGFLFLLLYHELKANRFGLLYRRLPPLEVLGMMNIRAAALGLAFLTVAILAGAFWASRLYPGFATDPMFAATLLVWGVYALCVFAHYRLGWRGERTIYLSISGFLLMGIALLGINVFLRTFHRFDALSWNWSL
jgi:ABC-type uncharacterized transport system permease subunit